MIESGTLGNVTTGCYYLIRFESRIMWVEILERGYGYSVVHYIFFDIVNKCMKVCVKGLELQETSCHHVEAGKIDDVFSHSLPMSEDDTLNNSSLSNNFFTHCLEPLGKFTANAYTKSRVTMTGIIDHPSNLTMMTSTFFKSLVWVLHKAVTSSFPNR